jgi:hypothetical protein
MKTKLLEAKAVIKEKVINILNTDMDISANWDVELIKKEEFIFINMIFQQVYGSFNWVSSNDTYSKKTSLTFSSDETWNIKCKCDYDFNQPIFPTGAIINFDKKTIEITL